MRLKEAMEGDEGLRLGDRGRRGRGAREKREGGPRAAEGECGREWGRLRYRGRRGEGGGMGGK